MTRESRMCEKRTSIIIRNPTDGTFKLVGDDIPSREFSCCCYYVRSMQQDVADLAALSLSCCLLAFFVETRTTAVKCNVPVNLNAPPTRSTTNYRRAVRVRLLFWRQATHAQPSGYSTKKSLSDPRCSFSCSLSSFIMPTELLLLLCVPCLVYSSNYLQNLYGCIQPFNTLGAHQALCSNTNKKNSIERRILA